MLRVRWGQTSAVAPHTPGEARPGPQDVREKGVCVCVVGEGVEGDGAKPGERIEEKQEKGSLCR